MKKIKKREIERDRESNTKNEWRKIQNNPQQNNNKKNQIKKT